MPVLEQVKVNEKETDNCAECYFDTIITGVDFGFEFEDFRGCSLKNSIFDNYHDCYHGYVWRVK